MKKKKKIASGYVKVFLIVLIAYVWASLKLSLDLEGLSGIIAYIVALILMALVYFFF